MFSHFISGNKNLYSVEGEGVDGCTVEDNCNDLALPSGQKINLDEE